MKPDSQEPVAPPTLLRQQLILAQVRIMELEDARDALAPRLQELDGLLRDAQRLADRKLEESAHLEKVLAETRAQAAELSTLHTQAARDLVTTRAEADIRLGQRDQTVRQLETALAAAQASLQAIRATRSWRWTAWLRGKSDA